MRFDESELLGERLHACVPGGAHTYAKGDDQYPAGMAPIIESGRGCHVRDVDGNEFIEYGMGLRSVVLGHAHPAVTEAASRQLRLGSNFVRPARIELECAEAFLDLVPGAEMVKFAKNGSDATTAALRLARAVTGRDLIACCADHPFFSVDDWFIGTTPMSAGIPAAVRDLTKTFRFNDLASVEALFEAHPGEIACLMLEPAKYDEPRDGFLERTQALCREQGALFILDEMITGFRWHAGGAQTLYGIEPDLSTFGKAMGNGLAVAALCGKREYMERGGLRTDQERVFLLSTTHGAETHALAGAIEVMRIFREEPVVETLEARGRTLAAGFNEAIAAHGLQEYVEVIGRPSCLVYATRDKAGRPSQPFRTLLLQETIRRGLLMPSLITSYAHDEADLIKTVTAVQEALGVYRSALDQGIEGYLRGRPVRPVMLPYNRLDSSPGAD